MISKKLRNLRKDFNISQVDLATKLGVTKQCVSNWENDNVVPSIDMLCKIADFFGVSTDYLLGRSEKRVVEVSSLTDEQIAYILCLVEDLATLNELKNR